MVSSTNGTDQLATVIQRLNEASIPVGEIGLRRPTLDEVFLSLTANRVDTPTTVGADQNGSHDGADDYRPDRSAWNGPGEPRGHSSGAAKVLPNPRSLRHGHCPVSAVPLQFPLRIRRCRHHRRVELRLLPGARLRRHHRPVHRGWDCRRRCRGSNPGFHRPAALPAHTRRAIVLGEPSPIPARTPGPSVPPLPSGSSSGFGSRAASHKAWLPWACASSTAWCSPSCSSSWAWSRPTARRHRGCRWWHSCSHSSPAPTSR